MKTHSGLFLFWICLLVSATNTRLLPWCLYATLKCYNIDFSPSAFVSVWPKVHLFCYLGKQNYTTDEDCFFIWHCQLRHMGSWWGCLYKLIFTIRHMHCIKNLAYTHVKGMLGENTWISLWLPLNNGKRMPAWSRTHVHSYLSAKKGGSRNKVKCMYFMFL